MVKGITEVKSEEKIHASFIKEGGSIKPPSILKEDIGCVSRKTRREGNPTLLIKKEEEKERRQPGEGSERGRTG